MIVGQLLWSLLNMIPSQQNDQLGKLLIFAFLLVMTTKTYTVVFIDNLAMISLEILFLLLLLLIFALKIIKELKIS
jgi:hypothetical protein